MASVLKTVLVLSVLLVASCATVGDTERSHLVGKWLYTGRTETCQYVFHESGTFSGYVTSGGSILSRFAGTWSVHNGAIFYEYTNDVLGRIPVGTRDSDKLVTIAKNYFVIEAADGSRRKYVRNG